MSERGTGAGEHVWWQRPLQVTLIGVVLAAIISAVLSQSGDGGTSPLNVIGTTTTTTSPDTTTTSAGGGTTTSVTGGGKDKPQPQPQPVAAFTADRWTGLATGVDGQEQSSLQFTLESPLSPDIDPTETSVDGELVFADASPVCTIGIYLEGVSITRGGYVFRAGSRCGSDIDLDSILLTGTPDAPTLTMETLAGPITATLTPEGGATPPASSTPSSFTADRWTGLATGVDGQEQSSLQFTLESPLSPDIDPTETSVDGELVFADASPVCTIGIYLEGVSITRGGYVFRAGSRCGSDIDLDSILLTGTPDAPTLTMETLAGPITATLR